MELKTGILWEKRNSVTLEAGSLKTLTNRQTLAHLTKKKKKGTSEITDIRKEGGHRDLKTCLETRV